jgi:hypothetical protein
VYIKENLIVQGSSSLQNITASAVDIGTNRIILNVDNPSVRYAGISVYDSGSTQGTGSLWWDSLNNHWLYEHPSDSAAPYNSAILISGPKNTGNLGEELELINNYIVKAVGGDHISSSAIYDDGTTIALKSNTEISGTLVANGTTLVSGSSQIDVISTRNITRLATTGSNQFSGNQIITGSMIIGASSNLYPVNVYTSSANVNNVIAEFYNADYASGTKNFIRVRNGISAGSTMSSYFGQGQDNNTYIVSNDFSRGGDIVINGNTGKTTIKSGLDVTGSITTTSNVTIGTSYSISQLNVGGQSAQTTAALTDSGTRNGLIEVLAAGGAAGNGGGIVFGSNTQGNDTGRGQVAIKASLISGAGMGTSDLVFSTRAQTSDTNLTERLKLTSAGVLHPTANGTQDLGSSSLRWGTVYTSDLSLNNGIGDWTIVEGEDDLFLYNNKKGKVYKFALTEVDPNVATPKKS